MISELQSSIVNKINKTSYTQCIVDIATELNHITCKINSEMQLVINQAENDVSVISDAQSIFDRIMIVLDESEKNINKAKFEFLDAYNLWLNKCLTTNKTKVFQSGKKGNCETIFANSNNEQNANVFEVEESSPSDIEIVNEIKYFNEYGEIINDKESEDIDTLPEITATISNLKSKESENKELEKNSEGKLLTENNITVNNCETLLEKTENSANDKSIFILDINKIDLDLNKKKNYNSVLNVSSDSKFLDEIVNNNTFDIKKNIYYLSDKKLQLRCIVLLEGLTKERFEKNKQIVNKSGKSFDDQDFERLIDLSLLEKKKAKRQYISSDDSSTCSSSNNSIISKNNKITNKNYKKPKISLTDHEISSYYTSSDESTMKINDCITSSDDQDVTNRYNEDLIDQTEEKLKQKLLEDTSSEDFDTVDEDIPSISYNKKYNKRSKNSDSLSDDYERDEKSIWLKDKLLQFKLSEEECDKNQKNKKNLLSTNEISDSATDDSLNNNRVKKKKTVAKKLNSINIENNSDSDTSSSDTESEDSLRLSVSEDCQILNGETQISEDCKIVNEISHSVKNSRLNDDVQILNSPISGTKLPGRRNIRKLLEDQQIAEGTRQAGKDEENRLQRLEERNKKLQDLIESENIILKEKLVLDYDLQTKKELISVDKGLVVSLKPHQEEGIRFMWDSCFESVDLARSTEGSGCILAHCMGLGKTFQIVTLVHTILTNKITSMNTVMVVCPMNTIHNWVEEFDMWLKNVKKSGTIPIHELTEFKKPSSRLAQLKLWHQNGGVLIIGYEMFRTLTSYERKLSPMQIKKMKFYLMDPGADLVVCDEGHLLKNEESLLANKMQRIRTKRRIILTGTPLQNNLSEYHCMVQFVKPNLLGTKIEFQNRFSNPITNGQFDNSTPKDVKLMKHRAHVLHRMLKGCVQRRDYAVLTPFLPPKQEYVILIRLSKLQIEMYQYYINNIVNDKAKRRSLFNNYNEIKRLVAHPKALHMKMQNKRIFDYNNKYTKLSSNQICRKNSKDFWWSNLVNNEQLEDLNTSYKLILLFGILENCEKEKDKLLVFSQCLNTLDTIQKFLRKIDEDSNTFQNLFKFDGKWKFGLDYFRLDGTVNSNTRNIYCKTFNDPLNKRARLFLISTKAGGLGINLVGANRVIVFDPSWNPSNDVQSIFRVFRFGQKKPCYIYRFLSAGTMEQKIYNRQVTKLSLSLRVLDEQQIERHYRDTELAELYEFDPLTEDIPTLNFPRDHVLADVFLKYRNYVYNFFEHDSLLENKEEEELDEDERKQAWLDYQQEKLEQNKNENLNKNKGKISTKKRLLDKTSECHKDDNVIENNDGPASEYSILLQDIEP